MYRFCQSCLQYSCLCKPMQTIPPKLECGLREGWGEGGIRRRERGGGGGGGGGEGGRRGERLTLGEEGDVDQVEVGSLRQNDTQTARPRGTRSS